MYEIDDATKLNQFEAIDSDYRSGRKCWRKVTDEQVRTARTVAPPVEVPHGFVLGESIALRAEMAVLATYAFYNGQYYVIYAPKHEHREALLGLWDTLAYQNPVKA